MPKRKILYVVNSLGIGGAEKIVQFLANTISPDQFEINILCLQDQKDIDRSLLHFEKHVRFYFQPNPIHIDYSILSYLKISWFGFLLKRKIEPLLHQIIEINPDILHFHTHPKDLLIGNLLVQKFKCALVFTDHSSRYKGLKKSIKTNLFCSIIRKLYRQWHNIFISSNNLRISEELDLHTKTSSIIKNSVDLDFFNRSEQQTSENRIHAVYISRIAHKKGHEDLIRAWAKIDRPNKKLYIVGPDELNGSIQRLATLLCKPNEIEFTGGLKEIKPILEKCDFGIFPSYQEGLPLSLLEMMAMQLPVIVSDIPELTSIILDNENGMVFRLGNPDDLAEKIESLLSSSDKRKSMAKQARLYVEREHSNDNYVKKHIQFYTQLLK